MRLARFLILISHDLLIVGCIAILSLLAYHSMQEFITTLCILAATILLSGGIIYWICKRWEDSK